MNDGLAVRVRCRVDERAWLRRGDVYGWLGNTADRWRDVHDVDKDITDERIHMTDELQRRKEDVSMTCEEIGRDVHAP